jgi:prepilin-type N-terminal cleavage/methylation domain-containing protein
MMKRLFNQAGFTITELMVVIVISGFLMAVAAVGFSTFFAKFEELNQVSELQKGAFDCLMQIQGGIPMGQGQSFKKAGVNNMKTVTFVGSSAFATSSTSIILSPNFSSPEHINDYIRIFHDGKYVRATYLDGSLQPSAPLYLFPKPSRNNKIEVTKLMFSKANNSEIAKVVKVELEARLKLGNNKYRYIKYTTRMAVDKD